MADDRAPKPAPRPRRRRTDIDPNAPTPPVANERRRRKQPTPAEPSTGKGAAAETVGPLEAEARASIRKPRVAPEPAPAPVSDPAPPAQVDAAASDATPTDTTPTDTTPTDATQPFHVPGLAGLAEERAATAAAATTAVAATATATPEAQIEPEPAGADPGRAWLARLDDRSLDPNICPFLRASVDGKLASPVESPDPSNRCAALSEAVPQSLRQQELVCLSSGHVNCPRYLRGAATATETPTPTIRAGSTLSTPIFVSLVILVMTISASAAFVMARGGLVLSGDLASPSAAAVVATASPSMTSTPSISASPSVSIAPTPSASPAPTPSATPSATPAPTPTGTPRSDRYKLLTACPNTPRCWIYTVRHGDNVFSIAHYFGISTDSIYARNPWLKQTGLRAGQHLRLPPPTR